MSIDVYLSHVDIYSAKLSIDDSIFLSVCQQYNVQI
jgi:hypothetical protein